MPIYEVDLEMFSSYHPLNVPLFSFFITFPAVTLKQSLDTL